jgi:hypothetical protein
MHEISYTHKRAPLSIDPKANQSRHVSADFRKITSYIFDIINKNCISAMAGCPVPVRIATEPLRRLAYEGAGRDAGDSSHSEIQIDANIYYINRKYNML